MLQRCGGAWLRTARCSLLLLRSTSYSSLQADTSCTSTPPRRRAGGSQSLNVSAETRGLLRLWAPNAATGSPQAWQTPHTGPEANPLHLQRSSDLGPFELALPRCSAHQPLLGAGRARAAAIYPPILCKGHPARGRKAAEEKSGAHPTGCLRNSGPRTSGLCLLQTLRTWLSHTKRKHS